MGYPHPPHPKETVVLSQYFGDAAARTFRGWTERGGYAALRQALGMTPEAIIEEVKASGLRGRGGAGFPTGLKWSFMPKGDGKPHYLCCNADESEPGTFKDREIMRWTPHALIEGCAIASYAIGAETCYIYIRGEFTEPLRIMQQAVAEAYEQGALGRNVFGSGKRIEMVIHRGAGAYICGEETALMNSLEGKRGNPRIKPPFPAAAGLFGMPTTINNVETLAAVPHILTRGAAWYRGLCRSNPKSTGTKLFSVCGHVLKPGNYEVTMGFPMKELIYELAGGLRPGRTLKAVIPGGSSVPIMTREEAETALCDYEGIAEKGSMLGSAGCIVMDDSADIVYEVFRLAKFYAHESCAQCTQCREGTAWTTRILERILHGEGKPEDLDLLLELSEQMTGKTICVLSDSCAAPIVSGIRKFRGEFERYLGNGRRGTASGSGLASPAGGLPAPNLG
jgi:NADH-quinone oxidoreductase subunit F